MKGDGRQEVKADYKQLCGKDTYKDESNVLREDIKSREVLIYDGRYGMWGVCQDVEFNQCYI